MDSPPHDVDLLAVLFRDVAREQVPSDAEHAALFKRLDRCRQRRLATQLKRVKQEIWRRNLRLAICLAKRYACERLPLLDAIQVAALGLERAITKYNRRLGYKFSTYASRWVKSFLLRELHKTGPVSGLPQHGGKLHPDTEAHLPALLAAPADAAALADVLPAEDPARTDTLLLADLRRHMLRLPAREREVLWRRAAGETLRAIGFDLNISRERVSQLEERGLNMLARKFGLPEATIKTLSQAG